MQNISEKVSLELTKTTLIHNLVRFVIYLGDKGIIITDEIMDDYEEYLKNSNSLLRGEDLHLKMMYKKSLNEPDYLFSDLIERLKKLNKK